MDILFCLFFRPLFVSGISVGLVDLVEVEIFPAMVARLLIGDNNLSRFWASVQFARSSLKSSVLVTATDLDALDHALTKVDERDQVIISVLTSILMEEVNQDEVGPSAFNVCEATVSRLVGVCPRSPSCQVLG